MVEEHEKNIRWQNYIRKNLSKKDSVVLCWWQYLSQFVRSWDYRNSTTVSVSIRALAIRIRCVSLMKLWHWKMLINIYQSSNYLLCNEQQMKIWHLEFFYGIFWSEMDPSWIKRPEWKWMVLEHVKRDAERTAGG